MSRHSRTKLYVTCHCMRQHGPIKHLTYELKMFSFFSAPLREGLDSPHVILGNDSSHWDLEVPSLPGGSRNLRTLLRLKSSPVVEAIYVKRPLCLSKMSCPSWRGNSATGKRVVLVPKQQASDPLLSALLEWLAPWQNDYCWDWMSQELTAVTWRTKIRDILGGTSTRHWGIFFFFATPRGMQDLSSPTREWTCAPCSGNAES